MSDMELDMAIADFLMWNRHDTANYFIQRKKKKWHPVNGY